MHTENVLSNMPARTFPTIVEEMKAAFEVQKVSNEITQLAGAEQWSAVPVDMKQMIAKLFLSSFSSGNIESDDLAELLGSSILKQNVKNIEVLFVSIGGGGTNEKDQDTLAPLWTALTRFVESGLVMNIGLVDPTVEQLIWLENLQMSPKHVQVHSSVLSDKEFASSPLFQYCKQNSIVLSTHADATGKLDYETVINFVREEDLVQIRPNMAMRYTVSAIHRATSIAKGCLSIETSTH
eukprot:CFRG6455T1